jgi:hypothetical protein
LNENEKILIAYYSKQTEVYCKEILYSSEFHAKGGHNKRFTEEMKKNNTGNPKSVFEFNMCRVFITNALSSANYSFDKLECR